MMSSLEHKGFISSDATLPRENRRSTLVLLTPKGRELLGDEKSEFNMKLDALIAAMGHEDIEELIRDSRKTNEHSREAAVQRMNLTFDPKTLSLLIRSTYGYEASDV